MRFGRHGASSAALLAFFMGLGPAFAQTGFEKRPEIVLPALPPAPVHLGKPHPEQATLPSKNRSPLGAPAAERRAVAPADSSRNAPIQNAPAPTALATPRPPMESVLDAFVDGQAGTRPVLLATTREAIRDFYASRNYAPFWLQDGAWTAAARAVVAQLNSAGLDGLDPRRLAIPDIAAEAHSDPLKSDLALTIAVVLYGEQASGGVIDSHLISPFIAGSLQRFAPSVILSRVMRAPGPARSLEALNPPQAGYRALKEKLAELRLARATAEASLRAPLSALGRTATAKVVPAGFSPDFDFDAPDGESDQAESAIRAFQRIVGLSPSGRLTRRTAQLLIGRRGAALESDIIANMQFWRWVPRHLGAERIDVNIPDFTLSFYEDHRLAHQARVVVGKPTTPTPIFSDSVRFVVINPAWRVPQSIIQKDMLPKLATDPDYFAQAGLIVKQLGNRIEVTQPPGSRNALGRIKFLFPNDYAVYLHDTPDRYLFRYAARAFSHGCVRMQNPFDLAAMTLGRERGWSKARLKGMVGYREQTFRLKTPIPIHMMYFTAFVDAHGRLQLRKDLYGYVRKTEAALRLPS